MSSANAFSKCCLFVLSPIKTINGSLEEKIILFSTLLPRSLAVSGEGEGEKANAVFAGKQIPAAPPSLAIYAESVATVSTERCSLGFVTIET